MVISHQLKYQSHQHDNSKHGYLSFDTKPYVLKYIETFQSNYLRDIENEFKVKIQWNEHYSNVRMIHRPDSPSTFISEGFEKLKQIYQYFSIELINMDIKVNEMFKDIWNSVLLSLPHDDQGNGIIYEWFPDESVLRFLGTRDLLEKLNIIIKEKLNINKAIHQENVQSISPHAPPKDVLSHETVNGLKVVVCHGDITKENTDIIVNACNKHLDHAGGVSYAIAQAGGRVVKQESDDFVKRHGYVKVGEVATTSSGYLSCKNIIHAVGPQWKVDGPEETKKIFHKLFQNVYKAALKVNAKSMAMPAISSGIYGVPKNVCAKATFAFLTELDNHLALDGKSSFEVRLVNIDVETVNAFTSAMNKWKMEISSNGKKIQRRHSLDSLKKKVNKTSNDSGSYDDTTKMPTIKSSLSVFDNSSKLKTKPDTHRSSSLEKSKKSNFNEYRSSSSASSSSGKRHENTKTTYISNDVHDTSSDKHLKTFGNVQQMNHRCSTHEKDLGRMSSLTINDRGSVVSSNDKEQCTICHSPYENKLTLKKCGHTFCKDCIEKAFTYQKKCPICNMAYGVTEGDQPPGTMEVRSHSWSLPGYDGDGCYVIDYIIPDGTQSSNHPNPGKRFSGTKRRAYLPASKEGDKVLRMLKKAFDMKLVFTIGRSNTTGQDDCVTWNDIHHKTSIKGGPTSFGYPDPTYLNRVTDELMAKGITLE
ncbi:uncharacterized protein LOC124436442 isoform X2 [Xenia sp. Carnegie-2017]|nr:uncharacterized protein LOC124436442 isoform X2 [Xenia sp. Carnegie-2017]